MNVKLIHIFRQKFAGLDGKPVAGSEDAHAPKRTIACLSSLVFSSLLLLMIFVMTPQDVEAIKQIYGAAWLLPHFLFRSFLASAMVFLIWRAIAKKTSQADFLLYLILGVGYAAEGTLFNFSYYLAYIEILVAVAWFSTLSLRIVLPAMPILGLFYTLQVLILDVFRPVDAGVVSDHIIGIWIATFGGLVGAWFRDYWQKLNAALVEKQLENNSRLIDLGQHMNMIFHDVNNSLFIISGHLDLLKNAKSSNPKIDLTVDRLSRATQHIIKLQEFVLGMAHNDKKDIRLVSGNELYEFISNIVVGLCPTAKPYFRLDVDKTKTYRCSPAALSYALVNVISNSLRVADEHEILNQSSPKQFAINVCISLKASGQMVVEVRDNGPGFPDHILVDLFKKRISTQSQAGHGIGLRNVLRYVTYQDGEVYAHNDRGAVVTMEFPNKAKFNPDSAAAVDPATELSVPSSALQI